MLLRRFRPPGRRASRGQALVETAVIVPVLVLLSVAAVDMGRAAYTAMLVTNAAHAGAMYGAQNNATAADNAGMQQAALNDGQNLSGLGATASHVCTCATSGASAPDCSLGDCLGDRLLEYAKVDTTATYTPIGKYPGLPSTFTLKGEALLLVKR